MSSPLGLRSGPKLCGDVRRGTLATWAGEAASISGTRIVRFRRSISPTTRQWRRPCLSTARLGRGLRPALPGDAHRGVQPGSRKPEAAPRGAGAAGHGRRARPHRPELHDLVSHSISVITIQTRPCAAESARTRSAKLATCVTSRTPRARRWRRCAACSAFGAPPASPSAAHQGQRGSLYRQATCPPLGSSRGAGELPQAHRRASAEVVILYGTTRWSCGSATTPRESRWASAKVATD